MSPMHPDNPILDEQTIASVLNDPASGFTEEERRVIQMYQVYGDEGGLKQLVDTIACRELARRAESPPDPFAINHPPPEALEVTAPSLYLGKISSGRGLPLPLSHLSSSMMTVGPSGTGKTTFSMMLVAQLVWLAFGTVLVIDPKGTWRRIVEWLGEVDRVLCLDATGLALSLLQPPPGTPQPQWNSRVLQLIADAMGLISAQRLLGEVVDSVLARGPRGAWPPLSVLIEHVGKVKPGPGGRQAVYRESLQGSLGEVQRELQGVFEYSSSNFLERLFAKPRLVILETAGLPPNCWTLLAGYLIEWLFAWRQNNPAERQKLAMLVLEDATPIVGAQRARNAPGGMSLLDSKSTITREFGIGLFVIAHEFGQVSPVLLSNLQTIVGFAPRREDDRLLQRLFNATPAQAQAMKQMPRGQAVALAPSVWPWPVSIWFPPGPGGGGA